MADTQARDPGPAYAALRWRCIGPHRGGRSSAVVGDPDDQQVFYFGAGGGGVWKTLNAGVTWENVSDGFFGTASVGALAVAPSDPNVIYAGMGECSPRGNVSYGDGVYRSTDRGRTWRHLGLADTRHIARVRVHPDDPDHVWVAALGHVFGPHGERGVYRSRDGGRSWERVLFRSENTGCIDLCLDPTNPRVLYAAMWQMRRTEWSMSSGGPESGLWKSVDGGDSWTDITRSPGLPEGVIGRIGVAVGPQGRVFALVEAEQGGVHRSEDGGATWRRVNESRDLRSRAWYYSNLYADPQDGDTLYALNNFFWKSIDGGCTFTPVATPHPDHHDLWIDPRRPLRMICGNDGGGCVSFDGGRSWSTIYNQPTAEFYHVVTDTRFPYRVYGSQQDNTTLTVPSRSDNTGIDQREWYDVGGAESASIAVRADNPDIVFASSSGGGEGGRLTRYDHRLRQRRDVSPWPARTAGLAARDYKYRFQWTSPVLLSPHDPNVLYMAGNRIFRSTDEGTSWELISPDLTRDDATRQEPSGGPITKDHTGVEVYCTVFALAESPLQKGLLWAGSDDGLIHVSRDGGGSWENVTPPDLPEWARVNTIEPSPHDAGTAYVAASRYRLDDTRPYLYRTRDFGKTWTAIRDGIPDDDYTRVVRADPGRQGLLFCGTETGVYVSTDDGGSWASLRLNLPLVAVHDLAVADGDLVAATHGRSFWVLDDITPLRQAEPRSTWLFPPRTTVRFRASGMLLIPRDQPFERPAAVIELPAGTSRYLKAKPKPGEAPLYLDAGQNPPSGAIVYYYLHQAPSGPIRLTFRDGHGNTIRTFSTEDEDAALRAEPGAHRFVWDMRYPEPTKVDGAVGREGRPSGPLAAPGEYRVELEADGETVGASFRIVRDPRLAISDQDLVDQFTLARDIADKASQVNAGINRLRAIRAQVDGWLERGKDLPAVRERAEALRAKLAAVEEELIQVRVRSPQDTVNFPPKLNDRVAYLLGVVGSADSGPTRQTRQAFAELAGEADVQLRRLDEIVAEDVPAFARMIRVQEVPPISAG